MPQPEDVEYTVVLVSPVFGEERQNAEQALEAALDYLNTHREKPGFRFAPYVSARLDIAADVEQAQAKLRTDDSVALMILHELPDDERDAFTLECAEQGVAVCHTLPPVEQPESEEVPARPKEKGWQVRFRKRSDEDSPAVHKICETILSAPLDGDQEEMNDRIGQLIAVMALSVMSYHWMKAQPRREWPG
jgi:hypothetical protein